MQTLAPLSSPQRAAFAPALPVSQPAPTRPRSAWLARPVAPPAALRRVFVVGCPRSGTTIMQARLAACGGLLTLPETHFFNHLLGSDAGRWRSRLLYARPHTHQRLAEVLRPLLGDGPLRRHFSGRGYVREFVRLLDAAAADRHAAGWLEKTPQHFLYIDMIQALCPDAVFVHVMRSGEDVVASAIEGEMQYAETQSFSGGIAAWVAQWNRAAETHLRYAGHPGHHVVAHEELVDDADATLARLLAFAGLKPRADAAAAAPLPQIADLRQEPWKRDAIAGRVVAPVRKFEALFGPQSQAWIRSRLHDYHTLCAEVRRRQA